MRSVEDYLNAKDSAILKSLLAEDKTTIEHLLISSDIGVLDKNQLILTYYSEQKLPFLLGHKVRYIPYSKNLMTIVDGIMVGVFKGGEMESTDFRYIYDENLGVIESCPASSIEYPSKRINCHPEIKEDLEKFVENTTYLQNNLTLVPDLAVFARPEGSEAGIPSVYTKPKLFTREDTRTPWYEYIDCEQPLSRQIESLFRLFTTFENEEIVLPIAVAASCQPSAISCYTQISVFYGLSGTGKSASCHLVEGLFNIPKLLSSVTYAGFRNHVEKHRWLTSNDYTGERNIHLVIDEISRSTLADPDFYTLLKGGVSMTTATIRLSSEKTGENKTFYCFGPKSFSTCQAFWQEEKYNEIRRRIFVFQTKKMSDASDFISKEEINYNECDRKLSTVLQEFWVANQKKYKAIVRKVRGEDRDILATICCMYEVEPNEAKAMLKRFRDITLDKVHKPDASAEYLDNYLQKSIHEAAANYVRAKVKYEIEYPNENIRVKASDLAAHLKQGANLGLFDRSISDPKNIKLLMESRGYELQYTREGGLIAGDSWFWIKKYEEI